MFIVIHKHIIIISCLVDDDDFLFNYFLYFYIYSYDYEPAQCQYYIHTRITTKNANTVRFETIIKLTLIHVGFLFLYHLHLFFTGETRMALSWLYINIATTHDFKSTLSDTWPGTHTTKLTYYWCILYLFISNRKMYFVFQINRSEVKIILNLLHDHINIFI